MGRTRLGTMEEKLEAERLASVNVDRNDEQEKEYDQVQ